MDRGGGWGGVGVGVGGKVGRNKEQLVIAWVACTQKIVIISLSPNMYTCTQRHKDVVVALCRRAHLLVLPQI